ncbi:DUF2189 domain-containing protein [Hydrogenovibrio sp. 3SP14C1]|uniref:DUF2189 domain-containing protein n=1 Tax=Hydrogenovibrio sp. 3SP14C1 TaxID=3038774 RepID=UPI00241793BC|nr:DUF2189 domain-containing protein [Hydrogenovibrio sp. 3SP14C1]MDG4811426.1 DUF2189 domain-containing protein [Hydrogenovibrio sp. 3SP14C1]
MAHDNTVHSHQHQTDMPKGETMISHEVQLNQIGDWLRKGWQDIAHAPLGSLFYGLLSMLLIMLTMAFFEGSPPLMLIAGAVFIFIMPFLAMGLYFIAYRLEKGLSPSVIRSLFAWRGNGSNIALFALTLGGILSFWLMMAIVIAGGARAEALLIVDTSEGVLGFLTSEAGLVFLGGFFLQGVVVLALVFTISVVTMPLMLRDEKVSFIPAMIMSYKVTMENKAVMAVWAIVLAVLASVGIATMGLGLVVIMPLLAYASWHAFNDLVDIRQES